jgi:hypothetical protein
MGYCKAQYIAALMVPACFFGWFLAKNHRSFNGLLIVIDVIFLGLADGLFLDVKESVLMTKY